MNPREILYIVEIIVYVPILVLGAIICLRHGFKRSDGWIFVGILALLRLIGASIGIAYFSYTTNYNLLAASLICSNIGLSPLLLSLFGFLGRVSRNARPGPIVNSIVLRIAHVPVLAALVISIIAGIDEFSSNSSQVSASTTYRKAAGMLYLASLVIIVVFLVRFWSAQAAIRPGEAKLVAAGVLSLPFLLVRILYTVLLTFDSADTADFSLVSTAVRAVAVEAVMGFAMEVAVVGIYIVAGMLTPAPEMKGDAGGNGEVGLKHMEREQVDGQQRY